MKTIAQELGLTIAIDRWMDEAPVPMNQAIVEVIEQKAKEGKYQYRMMHSGAGHDSQIIAPHYPTAMIFVPSIGGLVIILQKQRHFQIWLKVSSFLADTLYELAYK